MRPRASLWRRARIREAGTALLFLLPLLVLVVALIVYPVYRAVWLSLTDKLVGYPERFVGLQNYVYLAEDDTFHQVIRNSFVFTVVSVGLKVVTGVLMALVLNNVIRGRNFFRGLFLLPWITSTVIIALTWRWMFDAFPGRGFFNSVLLDLGLLQPPDRLHGHAGGRDDGGDRGQLVARLPVLRGLLPGRAAGASRASSTRPRRWTGPPPGGASGTSRCPGSST